MCAGRSRAGDLGQADVRRTGAPPSWSHHPIPEHVMPDEGATSHGVLGTSARRISAQCSPTNRAGGSGQSASSQAADVVEERARGGPDRALDRVEDRAMLEDVLRGRHLVLRTGGNLARGRSREEAEPLMSRQPGRPLGEQNLRHPVDPLRRASGQPRSTDRRRGAGSIASQHRRKRMLEASERVSRKRRRGHRPPDKHSPEPAAGSDRECVLPAIAFIVKCASEPRAGRR